MGWKDFLENLKLADIQNKIKIKTGNLVNINYEKNVHNINISDPEALDKFIKSSIMPDFEKQVKDIVFKRLSGIEDILNSTAYATQQEFTLAATTSTAVDLIKKDKDDNDK